MPAYTCDICSRFYVQKRNLKRHKDEKHNANLEYYNCIEVNCRKKFIRRSYLSKHLIFNHGYTSIRGREMACRAPRSNLSQTSYYEDISEDESIFALIDETERLRSQDESIVDFELNYLDNITLGDGAIGYDDSVGAMVGDSGNSDIAVFVWYSFVHYVRSGD